MRGTAQNPDVFFQAREAANPFHARGARHRRGGDGRARRHAPAVATGSSTTTARPDADRVVVVMGSAAGAVEETVDDARRGRASRSGMVRVRLFQPFPAARLVAALPPTVRSIAVLDRTKEPGAVGEPLYLDGRRRAAPKRWTPTSRRSRRAPGDRRAVRPVVEGVDAVDGQADLRRAADRRARSATSRSASTTTSRDLSLPIDRDVPVRRPAGEVQAVFFGLGSDGTVGANKSSVKIIGEQHRTCFAQGYFVYDSKKSGSVTVSHLRFGPEPIRSTYLIDDADFVACHQFGLLETLKVLEHAKPGRDVPAQQPVSARRGVGPAARRGPAADRSTRASTCGSSTPTGSPREAGMGNRINTVMQPCFFQLAGVLPPDEAIAQIKDVGRDDVRAARPRRSSSATSPPSTARSPALHRVTVPDRGRRSERHDGTRPCPTTHPTSCSRSPRVLLAGDGDLLPVSALPVDGTFPTGTARYEKRGDRQGDPDLGSRHLHRLRQVRDRVPARDDPHEGVHTRRCRPTRPPSSCTRSSGRRTSPATA